MQNYYWVVDFVEKPNGKIQQVIIGGRGFDSEMAAQRFLDRTNVSRQAKIIELSTRNQARASQLLKGKRVQETGDMSDGLVRVRHKPIEVTEDESPKQIYKRRQAEYRERHSRVRSELKS